MPQNKQTVEFCLCVQRVPSKSARGFSKKANQYKVACRQNSEHGRIGSLLNSLAASATDKVLEASDRDHPHSQPLSECSLAAPKTPIRPLTGNSRELVWPPAKSMNGLRLTSAGTCANLALFCELCRREDPPVDRIVFAGQLLLIESLLFCMNQAGKLSMAGCQTALQTERQCAPNPAGRREGRPAHLATSGILLINDIVS